VQFRPRFLGDQEERGAHESGQEPHEQQVGVDRLHGVERQDGEQRVGPQVLGGREEAEDHLQTEQEQGDDEVRIGDGLRPVPHGPPLSAV
jgi:hypothetical protein